MDPLARKIIGILAVIAGIILGIVAIVSTAPWATVKDYLAGGVIAACVAAGVLLL